jgi:hypothetical protein
MAPMRVHRIALYLLLTLFALHFCTQDAVATSEGLSESSTEIVLGSSKRNNADSMDMDVDSESLESIKRRRVDDARSIVQENVSRAEIEERMAQFIASKREQINESNRQEFIKGHTSSDGAGAGAEGAEAGSESQDSDHDGCARVDARKLNRTIQMKLETVKNEALTKTNPRSHIQANDTNTANSGLDERLRNIQVHLNLRIGKFSSWGRKKMDILHCYRAPLLISQTLMHPYSRCSHMYHR